MSNALTKQNEKFSEVIVKPIWSRYIDNTLGDKEVAKRFTGSLISNVSATPALQECQPASVIAAALLGETLGLLYSPQIGHYYLVPFNDKKAGVKKAQFILGAKGYVHLALCSGYYEDIDAIVVHEGEYRGRDKQTGIPKFEFMEDEDEAEKLPIIGYMARFVMKNGFKKVIYWSKSKIISHADKYSPGFSANIFEKIERGEISEKDLWKYSSQWYVDFNDMAKKTVLKQLIKRWGIMSAEMNKAIASEEHTISVSDDGIIVDEDIPEEIPEDSSGKLSMSEI